jgi:hypothetical protein
MVTSAQCARVIRRQQCFPATHVSYYTGALGITELAKRDYVDPSMQNEVFTASTKAK